MVGLLPRKREQDCNPKPVFFLCSPSFREYVIDLDEDSQHLIRYKTIAPLVASGAVQLI